VNVAVVMATLDKTRDIAKTADNENDNFTNTVIPPGRHSNWQKMRFTSLWFSLFIPPVTEAVFSKTIYIDYFGANAAAVGLFSLVYSFVGSLASVNIGLMMDTYSFLPSVFPPPKWGRRAPWLIFYIVCYACTSFLVYHPTAWSGIVQVGAGASAASCGGGTNLTSCKILVERTSQGSGPALQIGRLEIYYLITFCLQMCSQAGVFNAFFGVFPEMYRNPMDRAKAGAILGVFNGVSGTICVTVISFLFVRDKINLTGIVILNVVPLLVFSWPGISESRNAKFKHARPTIKCAEILELFKQKSALIYLMSSLLHYGGATLNAMFALFWLTRVAGTCMQEAGALVAVAGLAQLMLGVLTLPFWKWVIVNKKIHPRKIVCILYICLALVAFVCGQTRHKAVFLPIAAVKGMMFSVNNLSNRMFVGWIVDDDMVRRFKRDGSIIRREAFIQGVSGWAITGGYFLGGLMTTLLGMVGYNGSLPTRCLSNVSVEYIHFVFVAFSCIVFVLRGVLILFFPIYGLKLKEMEMNVLDIEKELKAKRISPFTEIELSDTNDAD